MEITKCSCGHSECKNITSAMVFNKTERKTWEGEDFFCEICGDKWKADGTVESHAELERDALAMRYIRDELIELQVNSFDEVDDEKWVAIRMKLGTDGNRKICPDATACSPQDAVFKAMER